MSSSSMCSRPAVSTRTVSWPTARASSSAERRISRGSARSGWCTFTPAWAPIARSCSRAAGRLTSVDTRSGWLPAAGQEAAELGRRRRLARALQPRHQITLGGRLALSSGVGSAPPSTSIISSRTTRRTAWSGVRLFRMSWPVARAADAVEELLHDLEVDVGLEEGEADLAQRGVDVGLGEDTLAAEGPEDALEPLAQRLEHVRSLGVRTPSQSKSRPHRQARNLSNLAPALPAEPRRPPGPRTPRPLPRAPAR